METRFPTSLKEIIQRFDRTTCRMTQKYIEEMEQLAQQGIHHLQKITEKYAKRLPITNLTNLPSKEISTTNIHHLAILSKKDPSNLADYYHNKQYIEHSKIKQKSATKTNQDAISTNDVFNEEIIKNIKKMKLQNNDYNYDQQDRLTFGENDELIDKQQDINGKSLDQLIEQSNKKANQMLQKLGEDNKWINNLDQLIDGQFDQDDEYPLTDYSSNQSSNQNNYDQIQFKDETFSLQEPLFGGKFSKNTNKNLFETQTISFDNLSQNSCPQVLQFKPIKTNTNLQKHQICFLPQQLLKSPKKSLKKKRLYIRQKRIPIWAENLSVVNQKVEQQSLKEGQKIFGLFMAQNLDSNIVFNINEDYVRTSSAKWKKQMGDISKFSKKEKKVW